MIFVFLPSLNEGVPTTVFDEVFFDELPEIGPHLNLFSLPKLLNPPKQAPVKSGGRLLTPAEGCGRSKVLTPRIVGGTPARLGNYL